MIKRRCNIYHFLQYEENGNVLLGKDKVKTTQKANIIYDIQCPACKEHYIGKTSRCFVTRIDEHGSRHDQAMFQHLANCQQFLEELSIINYY